MLGANDRVVLASIGIRGQGNALKRGFARLQERRDQDALRHRREPVREPRERRRGCRRARPSSPATQQDLRRVLDDKDIDGVIIATPNHWHALATIWALQAGKHVYVEKPASHTVWEGRKMVEAAAQVQQDRPGRHDEPQPARRAPGDPVHPRGRHRQGLHGARAVLQAAAVASAGTPTARCSPASVQAEHGGARRTSPPTTRPISSKVDYDLWLGPAPEAAVQPQPLPLQLALALGLRQRRHRQPGAAPVRHRALGPQKNEHPVEDRVGGRLLRRPRPRRRRPTCTRTFRLRRRHGPRVRDARHDTRTTKAPRASATCSTAPRAGCGSTATGARGSRTSGRKEEKGPGSRPAPADGAGGSDPTC